MEPAKQQPSQPQESTVHFLDYWRIIRIRKTVIISVFLLIAITATVVTFILPESYSSTARIEINPDVTDIPGMTGVQTTAAYDPYFIQTEFEIMQSEKVLGRVISNLDLNDTWGKKYNGGTPLKTEDTISILKNKMNLSPERNTKLVDVTVYSEDKGEAAVLANAIAQAYYDYRQALRATNTLNGIRVLEQQIDSETTEMGEMRSNVDQLRSSLGIVDFDPNSTAPSPTLSTKQLEDYRAQMVEDQKDWMQLQTKLDRLRTIQQTNPSEMRNVLPTMVEDGMLGDLLGKLHTANLDLATLMVNETTNDPQVMQDEATTNTLNSAIENRIDGIMEGLATQVAAFQSSYDIVSNTVQQAIQNDQADFAKGQPYWVAKLELANKEDFHKIMNDKIQSEEVELVMPVNTMVTIVDTAKPGKEPVKPNKTVNIVLGVVIGLMVGIGLAFFIEYLDTSVKTIDDVERTLQAPVLGVIPQNVGQLINEGIESQHAEAYRVLRTNLLFSRKDDRLNSVVVVSAGAGEGKSTTVLNLATVFAQSGQRVLLVDSDLRRPTLHKLLNVGNNLGLTNYLLKQNTIEEVIQRTNLPTLNLMASGRLPSSSMNILGSAPMKDMVSALKQRYDFVFFDSPPIMGVSDAAILASEMDMVVQVIQYRRYPQPMNVRAKQLIEKVGGNLIGIVLNNINMSQDESYYYYSGYYHGYYYYSKNEDEQNAEAAAKGAEGGDGRPGIKQKY